MDRLGSIERASLLNGLSSDQAQALVEIAHEIHFKKGEYLFRIGNEASTLFIVRAGMVEITLPLLIRDDDSELVVEELTAGETIAWSALVEPYTLTMNGRSVTDVELVGLDRMRLLKVFEAKPDLGYRVMSNISAVVGRRLHLAQAMWAREIKRSVNEKLPR